MSANSKTDSRTETLLVLLAAEVARKLNALNIPWLIDSPTDNAPNFFLVPEVKELLSLHTEGSAPLLGNVDFCWISVGFLAQGG